MPSTEHLHPAMESAYRTCVCRDCFDTAIGAAGAMCAECKEAGCQPAVWDESRGGVDWSAGMDCQRPDAYGADACAE